MSEVPIALKCPHITVTIVDMNEARIAAWNAPDTDDLSIYEPGLVDVVKVSRGRNLFFSTDVAKGIQGADIIFASVITPTKKSGIGAGRAADLRFIESVDRTIAQHSTSSKIVRNRLCQFVPQLLCLQTRRPTREQLENVSGFSPIQNSLLRAPP